MPTDRLRRILDDVAAVRATVVGDACPDACGTLDPAPGPATDLPTHRLPGVVGDVPVQACVADRFGARAFPVGYPV
jgi:hypothetical protein